MGADAEILERLPYRSEVARHQTNDAEDDASKSVDEPAKIVK
jgi:hypothetical protein